jgi:hypothetical protein
VERRRRRAERAGESSMLKAICPLGSRLALHRNQMAPLPVRPHRTIPNATGRPAPPLPSRPTTALEELPPTRGPRVAAQPGAISTKAMLASLLTLGVVAAGALVLMHSLVGPEPSEARWAGIPELQATVASIPIPPPTALAPDPTPAPRAPIRTSIAKPSAILALPRAAVATAPKAPPKSRQSVDLASDNPYGSGQ